MKKQKYYYPVPVNNDIEQREFLIWFCIFAIFFVAFIFNLPEPKITIKPIPEYKISANVDIGGLLQEREVTFNLN